MKLKKTKATKDIEKIEEVIKIVTFANLINRPSLENIKNFNSYGELTEPQWVELFNKSPMSVKYLTDEILDKLDMSKELIFELYPKIRIHLLYSEQSGT